VSVAQLKLPPDQPPEPAHDASPKRLTTLVQRHLPFVYRVLLHLGVPERDADDGTQQVFLVLARRLRDVAPGRERAFLSATAARIADRVRRTHRRRREELEASGTPEGPADGASPEGHLQQLEAQRLLLQVLECMPPDLREVLVLFELEELTMREIAEALELPQGTVASRIRRARTGFERLVEQLRPSLELGEDP
jgi:RNA polymerase sigma-70 factor (ECF subfamily)